MDLSLDAIKLPAWEPALAAEWDEAFEKVENYLRACRIASRLHRARLAAVILQRAIERQRQGQGLPHEDHPVADHAATGTTAPAGHSPSALPQIATPPPAPSSLASLAIEEARELIAFWLAGLLPPQANDRPFTLAEGYLALYLCDAPMRWPSAFLNPQQAPPVFAETLRARLVKTGPELEVSSMVPRPIDLGMLPDWADSAMDKLDRVPLIKTLLAWALFAAALVALFWYTRR